jgi:hypothetical protein
LYGQLANWQVITRNFSWRSFGWLFSVMSLWRFSLRNRHSWNKGSISSETQPKKKKGTWTGVENQIRTIFVHRCNQALFCLKSKSVLTCSHSTWSHQWGMMMRDIPAFLHADCFCWSRSRRSETTIWNGFLSSVKWCEPWETSHQFSNVEIRFNKLLDIQKQETRRERRYQVPCVRWILRREFLDVYNSFWFLQTGTNHKTTWTGDSVIWFFGCNSVISEKEHQILQRFE